MRHEESHIQTAVVSWVRYQYPNFLLTGGFAGETMTIQRATRRKRMGYLAGTADLFILEPKGLYHGLFIEMKAPKGVQSDSQKSFGERATTNGYCYVVCHSLAEAHQAVEKYLLG